MSKGLKVGDTFSDNNLLYKIIDIDANGNFISSLVGKASGGVKPPKVEKVEEKEEKVETDYNNIEYAELKKLAKEKGVSAKGSKEEIIERLKGV